MATPKRVRQPAGSRLTPEQEDARMAQAQAQFDLLAQQNAQVAAGLEAIKTTLDQINDAHQEINKELRKIKKVRESLQELNKKHK